jgi:hypothetical protein
VGENFGGGLFSTSPENLITYLHCADLLKDWNYSSHRVALALLERTKCSLKSAYWKKSLDLNFQKLIALCFRS